MFRITPAIACFMLSFAAAAQMPSMNISHQGLQPNDTLWVAPGDSIKFIWGGGGPHPMTSGHGLNPSPMFFPTVTVTSSDPEAIFTLDTSGVYLFHCATNPSNSMNWGTIIVDSAYAGLEARIVGQITFYPNPAQDILVVDVPERGFTVELWTVLGQCVLRESLGVGKQSLNIADVPPGPYILHIRDAAGEGLSRKLTVQ